MSGESLLNLGLVQQNRPRVSLGQAKAIPILSQTARKDGIAAGIERFLIYCGQGTADCVTTGSGKLHIPFMALDDAPISNHWNMTMFCGW
jgi:hypothetical protein